MAASAIRGARWYATPLPLSVSLTVPSSRLPSSNLKRRSDARAQTIAALSTSAAFISFYRSDQGSASSERILIVPGLIGLLSSKIRRATLNALRRLRFCQIPFFSAARANEIVTISASR